MRCSLAIALLIMALAGASGAAAKGPMTLLLASAHGLHSVQIGTDATKLHGRVWLDREGGSGTAHGRADVSCHEKPTAVGTGWMDQSFTFAIVRGGRQEVWQRTGNETCTISVSLQGQGELRVALRGY
jgi:hypothetical protein